MIAKTITNISDPNKSKILASGTGVVVTKTAVETCINTKSCGTIIGKPRIAMIAAFCWAFAAMAAKKVNTRLSPQPPKKTIPINVIIRFTGKSINNENSSILKMLMTNINRELKSSLASTKFWGLAIV